MKFKSTILVAALTLSGAALGASLDLNKIPNGTEEKAAKIGNVVVVIPSGKKDSKKEEANRKLVLEWFDDFWNKGNFDNWPKYMSADFRNHDPAEPAVGAQALVDWLNARSKESGRGKPAPKDPYAKLFVMADGDLVFVSHMPNINMDPNVDPAKTFAGNILRVKNGKIVEWWFTGMTSPVTTAVPAGMAAGGMAVAPAP
ncbi:MAG: nuclear transport factor 2 family protein [Steroidobacteraceae bacterium]